MEPVAHGGLGLLPLELQRQVLEFAVSPNWSEPQSKIRESHVLEIDGISLANKDLRTIWSEIVWAAHPKSVIVLATEPKVKLLHKIVGLEMITVFAAYPTISTDLQTFQQNFLGTNDGDRVSMVSRFPSLKRLRLSTTLIGVSMAIRKLKRLLLSDFRPAQAAQGLVDLNSFFVRAEKPSQIDLHYCASPRQQYSLDLLGEKPPGLILECRQFPLPQSLAGFHGVSLTQCLKLEGNDAKVVKASAIKSFQVDYFALEGCVVGNCFDNAMLAHLPKSLVTLTLECCVTLQMPYKFPPNLAGLSSLVLHGCEWKAGNASNCLPAGLKSLTIRLNSSGTEDGVDYKHSNFSVAGLPPALQTLTIESHGYPHSDSIPLVGALDNPLLTSLVVSTLPPLLPASLTHLKLSASVKSIPPVLPATLTHLTLHLERPHPKRADYHMHSLSFSALSASCPALEQLSLCLERGYRYYVSDDDLPPNLPALLKGDMMALASLKTVRCNDDDLLSALRALPNNKVVFSTLERDDDGDYF